MTLDLDTIIDDVETILRLRCATRVARETLIRVSTELSSVLTDLKQREAELAEAVGITPESTWYRATLKSGGWTIEAGGSPDAVGSIPAATPLPIVEKNSKRQRFDRRIRKGDVVWMSRCKALGTVRKIDRYGVHEVDRIPDGKVFLCMARNLWRPFPGETTDA